MIVDSPSATTTTPPATSPSQISENRLLYSTDSPRLLIGELIIRTSKLESAGRRPAAARDTMSNVVLLLKDSALHEQVPFLNP